MGQSHQAILPNQLLRRIFTPHRVPPTFRQKGIDAPFNPPIQPVEEPFHVRLAIENPPAAYHGIELLYQLP
jgi:hypothetical protein